MKKKLDNVVDWLYDYYLPVLLIVMVLFVTVCFGCVCVYGIKLLFS